MKGLPNKALPSHWQYMTSPYHFDIVDMFPDSAHAAIMAASRHMWLSHADPEIVMRVAGLIEVRVDDDLVTISLVFPGKVMKFKAQEPHKQDDIEAQTRIAMLAYQVCLQIAQ